MALKRYRIENRLADVLALIQVLSVSTYAHRSEAGLQKELQGIPRSANDWGTIAAEHPEFFRFEKISTHSISLVARHSTTGKQRPVLDAPFIGRLVEAAIELHDREEARRFAWDKFLIPLGGVVLGGLLSIATSYYAAKFQVQNQIALQEAQDAKVTYSRLMGHKTVIRQLHFSRAEAVTNSDYHEARWVLSGSPKSSMDLEEARWWQRKAHELVSEIVRENQSLHADIGIVQARFPDTIRLIELTSRVLNARAIKVNPVPKYKNSDELDRWKETATSELDTMVESEYVKPLDELLEYLLQQLHQQPS